jgi:protein phosphatase
MSFGVEGSVRAMKKKTIYIDCHGRTSAGKEWEENEDAFLIAGLGRALHVQQTSLPSVCQAQLRGTMQGQLFVVADSIGDHPGGSRQSTLANRAVNQYTLNTMSWFFNLKRGSDDDLKDQLAAALMKGRLRAADDMGQEDELDTTRIMLTMAYLLWPRLYVAHTGDGRGYLMRNGELIRITGSSSVAGRSNGATWADQFQESLNSDIVEDVIRANEYTESTPDVFKVNLSGGDVLLLCTDGLARYLSDQEIAEHMMADRPAEFLTRRLIDASVRASGADNATVIVSRFHARDQSER